MHYTPLQVLIVEDRNKAKKSPRFWIKEATLLSVHWGTKEERRENRPKNMPLPDKPRPHHRSPICEKLCSFTDEKGNSIGLCNSQNSPLNLHCSYLTVPSRTQWKLAWGVASKDSFAQQRKRKLEGRYRKENCYTRRMKVGATTEKLLYEIPLHLSAILSCIFLCCLPVMERMRNI
jgi:hypothetical protein